ncbi:hypothetical protein TRFO_22997 [Tritrichomonas foetus]|uniref:Uncharacterized protein n=1 Tax=Tritrichomonas foetus TaxID=1144522 RepID=A0A1J4KBZ1_9EUKA|nr:hypothetical protein TRFO_22997 [Tritrichomonas foetus]|eukprot:OHT08482.1 hypothetical protein TRFO_22997 [Tritrichomonas foetus]
MSYQSLLDDDLESPAPLATKREQNRTTDRESIIAIENEIRSYWKEIANVREDPTIKDTIKDLELVRMIDIHNRLDIEQQRKFEQYTKNFVESLRLYEVGVHNSIQGGTKIKVNNGKPKNSQAHNSYDPHMAMNKQISLQNAPGNSPLTASSTNEGNSYHTPQVQEDRNQANLAKFNHQPINPIEIQRMQIVQNRKQEITATLIELNRRKFLTPEEEQLKNSLMAELKTLQ